MKQTSAGGSTNSNGLTRRSFLGAATVGGMGVASGALTASVTTESSSDHVSSHANLLRQPDLVTAYCGLDTAYRLLPSEPHWRARSIDVEMVASAGEVAVQLSAPQDSLTHLHVRWAETINTALQCMGDAWERSYGDLAWRNLVPERPMPWYFATSDGKSVQGCGVKTGAKSLCFWQVDAEGVSLWIDVSNGGSGLQLGERQLHAATIVTRNGQPGENPIEAVRNLCERMCEKPRPTSGPIYGSNDWYYAYGNSSAEQILQDAELVASLRPSNAPKPFTVIDEGWANKAKFPDMPELAEEIRRRGVRPGIWLRPLMAPQETNASLLLPTTRFGERVGRSSELAFDPTIPEALQHVVARVTAIRNWGYELLKHDYSTYDLLGQWGFEMGARATLPGWSFHDRSKTNAEIIQNFYRAIRTAAGDAMLILGCNTMGHLGAGIFDCQRTGDDTSGKTWERTRRMGVNTLAFRLPQNEVFFTIDADCVAITQAIPWEKTRQWLDLVARSKTALFISAAKDATGVEQKKALAEAFALANAKNVLARPSDWFRDTTPETWGDGSQKNAIRYQWCTPEGAYPFAV